MLHLALLIFLFYSLLVFSIVAQFRAINNELILSAIDSTCGIQ